MNATTMQSHNQAGATTTSNLPAVFNFGTQSIRTFDQAGEVWFVAMDIASALGYLDSEAMTRKLDDDEKQNLQIVGFGPRGVTIINESGLYSSILSSKKAEAKQFKRWVTHEVLPAIRKTGQYNHTLERCTHNDRMNFAEATRMIPYMIKAYLALGIPIEKARVRAAQRAERITGVNYLELAGLPSPPPEPPKQVIMRLVKHVESAPKYAHDKNFGELLGHGYMPYDKLAFLMRLPLHELDVVIDYAINEDRIYEVAYPGYTETCFAVPDWAIPSHIVRRSAQ